MIRLFVAVDLPEGVRDRLAGLCAGLAGVRWVEPQNLHLTLRFIGEVEEPQFPRDRFRGFLQSGPPPLARPWTESVISAIAVEPGPSGPGCDPATNCPLCNRKPNRPLRGRGWIPKPENSTPTLPLPGSRA